MEPEFILKIFTTIVALFAAIWGIYSFNKQQQFKRLQNLNAVFQRFAASEDLLTLFSLFEEVLPNDGSDANTKLKTFSPQTKLKFLALLDEIGLYSSMGEIDNKYAEYLFQWHFYYTYTKPETATLFWHNLGGDTEKTKKYWSKSFEFAKRCIPE
jgi:hypothetical protein